MHKGKGLNARGRNIKRVIEREAVETQRNLTKPEKQLKL